MISCSSGESGVAIASEHNSQIRSVSRRPRSIKELSGQSGGRGGAPETLWVGSEMSRILQNRELLEDGFGKFRRSQELWSGPLQLQQERRRR
jgi:hypothetical protein